MSGFYPETNVDPQYPVIDTDFLPAVPQRVTSAQVAPLVAYVHTQSAASASWTITHNLNFYPNVTVVDSGDSIVEGEITYTSKTALTITFSSTISGKAYLS